MQCIVTNCQIKNIKSFPTYLLTSVLYIFNCTTVLPRLLRQYCFFIFQLRSWVTQRQME